MIVGKTDRELPDGILKGLALVEVVGIEPTSEKHVAGASTCVSFYPKSRLRALGEGQPGTVASLALYQDASQGLRTH